MTKNNPGPFDCYSAADPDEPLFILLGRDPMGGALVRQWAAMRRAKGEDPAKVLEAIAVAEAMDQWAEGLGKRIVGNCGHLVPLEDEVQALRVELGIPEGSGRTPEGAYYNTGPAMGAMRRALDRAFALGRGSK